MAFESSSFATSTESLATAAQGGSVVAHSRDATPKPLEFRLDAVDRAADSAAAAQRGALPPVPAGYALVDVNDEIDPSSD